jgi:hypothetical protein
MPIGPKEQKRPRDPSQLAKRVVEIATGEVPEEERNEARSKAGKKGAKARARSLTAEQRSAIASIAADARWKKT